MKPNNLQTPDDLIAYDSRSLDLAYLPLEAPRTNPALDVRAEFAAYQNEHLSGAYFMIALTSAVVTFVRRNMDNDSARAFVCLLRLMPRKSPDEIVSIVEALVAWCDSNGVVLQDR